MTCLAVGSLLAAVSIQVHAPQAGARTIGGHDEVWADGMNVAWYSTLYPTVPSSPYADGANGYQYTEQTLANGYVIQAGLALNVGDCGAGNGWSQWGWFMWAFPPVGPPLLMEGGSQANGDCNHPGAHKITCKYLGQFSGSVWTCLMDVTTIQSVILPDPNVVNSGFNTPFARSEVVIGSGEPLLADPFWRVDFSPAVAVLHAGGSWTGSTYGDVTEHAQVCPNQSGEPVGWNWFYVANTTAACKWDPPTHNPADRLW